MVGYVTVLYDGKEDVPLEKETHLNKRKTRGPGFGAGRYNLCGRGDA